jgi:hypothetical protein
MMPKQACQHTWVQAAPLARFWHCIKVRLEVCQLQRLSTPAQHSTAQHVTTCLGLVQLGTMQVMGHRACIYGLKHVMASECIAACPLAVLLA